METTTKHLPKEKKVSLFAAGTRLRVASWVLMAAGVMDLVRGFEHTFNIFSAAANIAQVDMTSPVIGDFLMVMSAFGISNYLTGLFAIIVALKAKDLTPLFLAIIPGTYVLGVISIRVNGIEGSSAFNGQYMLMVYMSICVLTALYYYVPKWLGTDTPTDG